MKFTELHLPGLTLIEPDLNKDDRGYFIETYRDDLFRENIGDINFIQDSETVLPQGSLRGFRCQQYPYEQNKLVRVLSGTVLHAVIDLRNDSPTYGQHEIVRLESLKRKKLFIPKGFGHAYLVISSTAVIQTKVDCPYMPEHETFIPADNIDWHYSGFVTPVEKSLVIGH